MKNYDVDFLLTLSEAEQDAEDKQDDKQEDPAKDKQEEDKQDDKQEDPPEDKQEDDKQEDPPEDKQEDDKQEDPPEDAPEESDEDAGDVSGEDTGDEESDDGSDIGGSEEDSNAFEETQRKERLYDAMVDIQTQCAKLLKSADFLMDRISDRTGKEMVLRAKKILTDTNDQCDTIRTRFSDIGYDRVLSLYATVRERVAAVAEIIKHVIDGDDDFRKPPPETPRGTTSHPETGDEGDG